MPFPVETPSTILLNADVISPPPGEDKLDYLIKFLSTLEINDQLDLYYKSGRGCGVQTSSGEYVLPDTLLIDPQTPLHIVDEGKQIILKSGECAVSPDFRSCQALLTTLENQNLHFAHVFPQWPDLYDARDQLDGLHNQFGVEASLIIAHKPQELSNVLHESTVVCQNPALLEQATVDYKGMFRVWTYVGSNNDVSIRVTMDNPTNELLNVNLI